MPQWYYGSSVGQTGPVEEHEILPLIASGTIGPETLVWRDGMKDWLPLRNVPELNGQLQLPYSAAQAYYAVPNNGLAIASMVCGIVSFFLCYFIALLSLPAVICGHLALNQIRDSPVPMAGRGMAIAGLVLGYLGIVGTVGIILFFGMAFAGLRP